MKRKPERNTQPLTSLQQQRSCVAIDQHFIASFFQVFRANPSSQFWLLAQLHIRQLHMSQQRRRAIPVDDVRNIFFQLNHRLQIGRNDSDKDLHRSDRSTEFRRVADNQVVVRTFRLLFRGLVQSDIRKDTDRMTPGCQFRRCPDLQWSRLRQSQPDAVINLHRIKTSRHQPGFNQPQLR